ncbi:uncharacterized protein LOC131660126 [Vicia villosa]|uniref:uncharacterized protein LOC131660126 n=1 Tax=Vicia villosa TaxID=3911 RepID=UPI00273AD63B|nr:uncharacterized protein LOC131660126 [Vicia villosa]
MASSSQSQQNQGSVAQINPEESYVEPVRTLLTPIDSLEVLYEMMVDFESMKENACDLTQDVEFQGWVKFFDRLMGQVFPKLVKELWIHATASNHQVTSYVMGNNIIITKDLIRRLIRHDGKGIKCTDIGDKNVDLKRVSKKIFTFGQPSNKFKEMKSHLRIWDRILLESSPPSLTISHLKTSVKETREDVKTKRDWIPLGRLISDILTENRLVEHLTETQQTDVLEAIAGKPFNAKNLKKMKIIEAIKKDTSFTTKEVITTKRVPLDNFPLFSAYTTPDIVVRYLEAYNQPWVEKHNSEAKEKSPAPQQRVVFIEKDKSAETSFEQAAAAAIFELPKSSVEASSSLVLKTLEEQKKENEVVRARLDKQDETN